MIELIEALHVIQDECESHKNKIGFHDCKSCPLSNMKVNRCLVGEQFPDYWKINDEVQKALL